LQCDSFLIQNLELGNQGFLQAFISSAHIPNLHYDWPQLSSNLVKAYVKNMAMILTIRSAFCLWVERKS
jgi:hypothetical protein